MTDSMAAKGLPRAVIDDVYLAPVHINVGGTTYTTTLTTLTKFPDSKLAKLFNGTLAITVDPINNHYFLDVDGSVFSHILNFLRYDKLVLPEDFDQLPLLKEQVEFFELEVMLAALTDRGNVETDGSEREDGNVRQRQRRRRTARKNKERQETAEGEAGTGQEEGGTVGDSDVVTVETFYHERGIITLYSSAELSLEEPLPEFDNLKHVSVGVGHCLKYEFWSSWYTKDIPSSKELNPCLVHFFKQLLDKGYKLSAVSKKSMGNENNRYVFIRMKQCGLN